MNTTLLPARTACHEVAFADRVTPGSRGLVQAWLASFRSADTRSAYERDTRAFLCWLDGWRAVHGHTEPLDLLSVLRQEVDVYARSLDAPTADRPALSAATVARRLASLGSLFAYAEDEDLIDRSPVTRVRRPRVSREGRTAALTRREAAQLRQAALAAGNRDALLVLLLLDNGMRVSEALSVRVGASRPRGRRCEVEVVRKGGTLAWAAMPSLTCQAYDAVTAGREPGAPALIDGQGAPMDRHDVTRALVRLARAAGIQQPGRVTPHVLRATFITTALRHRALDRVQADVGHADPRTTLRYDRRGRSLAQHSAYAVAADFDSVDLDGLADDDEDDE